MPTSGRDRIREDTVCKAVNALLKWKKKKKSLNSQSDHDTSHHEEEQQHREDEGDVFVYLSITLKKVPPKTHTLAPHRIPLRRSLLSLDYPALNICLIVDGKKIKSESAHKILAARSIPFVSRVFKLSKLKSDYKSFESKQKLYNSFDVFLADKNVVALLPNVLGKVFYKKKRKIPVPVDLNADGSNWREEMEKASNSSLLCLSSGSCSAVRVGKWGVNEGNEIVENVFEAVDGVLKAVPRKWAGIRCLHLKFSDSVALPIYERKIASKNDDKV